MALFGSESAQKRPEDAETIIGSSVRLEGKLVGKGTVLVHGVVVGSVKTQEDVHVAEGADVKASIEAMNVTVAGTVEGPVKARGRLELSASARIIGDVEAKTVAIAAGAVLNGKCVMTADVSSEQQRSSAKLPRRLEQPAN